MKFNFKKWLVLCCGALLFPLLSSAAVYMDYDGKTIKGSVITRDYEDCHSIDSIQWGVGRAISMEAGNLANREASRPSFSEITLTRQNDVASAHFFFEAIAGSRGKKVLLHFVRTGVEQPQEYMQIELDEVLVSSLSQSSGGDRPSESITLSYSKITITTWEFDEQGRRGASVIKGYDLAQAKPL